MDLSKSGVSFSNDIAGMAIASKGMRLEMDEFQDVMKNNTGKFIALGGNVTRGAEAFAKLSEEFMSSEFIPRLREAGFSHKELNEILAMQMATRRLGEKDDVASRKAAIEAAAKLATEMDLQAKLTGKSREEQMATMKKAREDMAIEAKMRQMAAERGISVEEMRQKYAESYNQAVLSGTEQSFREAVLYGRAVSKEAAMEGIGAGQSAFQSSIKSGMAFVKGDFEEASELQKKARTETIEYQRTAQAQNLAMIPSNNAAVQSIHKVMKATMGTFDSLDAVSKRADMKDKDTSEQAKFAKEEAQRAQKGVNELGQEASGASKALINFKDRVGDYEAALYKNIGGYLNKQLGPGLGQLSDQSLGVSTRGPGGEKTTVSKELDRVMQAGLSGEKQEGAPPDSRLGFTPRTSQNKSDLPGAETLRGAAAFIKEGSDLLVKGVNAFNVSGKPQMFGGTPGAFNKLFVDFGAKTEADLHGKEAVLNEKQMMNLVTGVKENSVSDAVNKLTYTISGSKMMPADISDVKPVQSNVSKAMMDTMKQQENLFQSLDVKSMMAPLQNMDFEKQFKEKFVPKADTKDSATQKADEMGMSQAFNEALIEKQKLSMSGKDTKATLDDVVGSLNNLNTKIERLLDAQLDLGTRQIKATKSNNSNIYSRA
jgi:hypothetical protein